MFALLTSEIKATHRFPRINCAIKGVKENIKGLESSKITALLKNLKDDEDRLKKCIDDIEDFHRDMFVLLNKEDKPADTEIAPAMKDDVNKTEYSVTEPECSGNEPMYSVNEPGSSQNSARRRLILKIPKSLIRNGYSSKNEWDDSNESSLGNNESGDSKNETGDGFIESGDDVDEPGDGKNESSFDMDESNYEMDESNYEIDESGDGKDELGDGKDESGDGKSESSDNEKEMAKKILLNLLADKEKGITKLVLLLINKFSRFQSNLQKAEASVSQSTKIFPVECKVKVKKKLQALSESVLYLDKTVSKIYAKYSKMLRTLDKVFQ